jgi:DnaJ-class molecular chaperone
VSRGAPKVYLCSNHVEGFCTRCNNTGRVIGWRLECGDCGGKGHFDVKPTYPTCPSCDGAGWVFISEEAPR